MKTIFATAAALTLSLTLAACSGSDEDTADAGEDPWANIPLADEIAAPADEAEAPVPADEAAAPVDAAEAVAAVEPEGGIVEPEPVALGGPENTLYLELACGRVVIEMRPDLAPLHVAQIKTLTREGFYDGVIFHRVIEGFMAQSGDPTGTGFGASELPNIPAEFSDAPFIRGAVGMGRGEAVDSANSQFFIMFEEGRFLDGLYTLWGHVTVGMDCVDQIARGEPPANPDVILTMVVAADAPADEAGALAPAGEADAPDDAAEAVAAVEPEGGVAGIVEPEPVVLGGPENTLYLELGCGRVVIEMRPDLAPLHVEQIRNLAREGFYDGVIFHRVIEGFMAQSGDPTGTGFGGSQLPNIPAEFSDAPFVRGAVGMARGEAVDSANSQFFIMLEEGRFLDGLYTYWGDVTVGMDCVDQIARGEPPANPDVILTMRVAADVQ